ncbi:unnamed protein product [Haemonchus placei]|uniref:VbhA domain-containing protein n=1 Tax=Haemonchus placei TaxID=6290 RepID=A0A0N4X966_HAEPC|nr:unnamed protein product [Haemonchus placei]
MNQLSEAVATAQAQAQAEAAYNRQLQCESEILEMAFQDAVYRLCRLKERFEVI